jgi:hypothetical protein
MLLGQQFHDLDPQDVREVCWCGGAPPGCHAAVRGLGAVAARAEQTKMPTTNLMGCHGPAFRWFAGADESDGGRLFEAAASRRSDRRRLL